MRNFLQVLLVTDELRQTFRHMFKHLSGGICLIHVKLLSRNGDGCLVGVKASGTVFLLYFNVTAVHQSIHAQVVVNRIPDAGTDKSQNYRQGAQSVMIAVSCRNDTAGGGTDYGAGNHASRGLVTGGVGG